MQFYLKQSWYILNFVIAKVKLFILINDKNKLLYYALIRNYFYLL